MVYILNINKYPFIIWIIDRYLYGLKCFGRANFLQNETNYIVTITFGIIGNKVKVFSFRHGFQSNYYPMI